MTELAALSVVAVLSTVSLCFALLRFIRQEREATAVERANLLLRIQAPEVVVTRAINEDAAPGPEAIDMSDGPHADDSYWQAREETIDEMAERLMAEETRG